MTAHPAHVRDVDETTFQTDVIERSRQVPVVVDFWASWCGPCRILGPVLERLAAGASGGFELVKVDVDRNPRLAQQYRVQGIPAVKAFRDGRQVDEFVGALPEPQVAAWLRRIVPSGADRRAAEGRAAEDRGDSAAAERAYRAALAENSRHQGAAIGLASLLGARGAFDEAERLLEPYPADPEAQRVRAGIRFRRAGQDVDFAALKARVEANPRDADAHYQLGLALAGDEAYTAALDHLLEVVRLDRHLDNDGARRSMLELFALLGEDDPRTQDYRRRLSNILF